MTRFLDSDSATCKPAWLPATRLAVAGCTVLLALGGPAGAASARNDRAAVSVESRVPGAPLMAIVSLRSQHVTVYDAGGWIMRAPVSTGQRGRETPAGVFSIIEKEAEHYSNLYDDAYMPHMERITWSGIALHGGPLPGYPASHGCIRMPYDFASRLFDVTKLGMRVIVAPTDVAPVEITHPALFTSRPEAAEAAAARAAEAGEAARKADQAKLAATTASREADRAAVEVRAAEGAKRRADALLAAAAHAVAVARSDDAAAKAEEARANAAAKAAEADVHLTTATAELQAKRDAAEAARHASADAETRRAAAAEAARQAARSIEPASVFISRKTQRLYVRQGFQPVLESPVTIQDPDRPIGTHVFTALDRIPGTADIRWNVVSLESGHADGGGAGHARGGNRHDAEPVPTDPGPAQAALDRITIPQDVRDRIAGMISPRSSLIVSDEALSPETGKGTEFVVLMSGEPQGGIAFRHHRSQTVARRDRLDGEGLPFWRSPFRSPFIGSW